MHGFAIMPDYVHFLLTVSEKGTIADIMRDWKSRMSHEINQMLGWNGALWQRDYWAHGIRGENDSATKLEYIHQNPVRAGFVDAPEHWWYSSARWYEGQPSCFTFDHIG